MEKRGFWDVAVESLLLRLANEGKIEIKDPSLLKREENRSLEENLRVLPRRFYLQPTQQVAKDLLGKVLVDRDNRDILAGVIVETEAYLQEDPACHAFRGLNQKNQTMFGEPGIAYIYPIHRYYCLNVVTAPAGVGEAVLIRAVIPFAGLDLMYHRRGVKEITALCSGPGRLCQAFGLTRRRDGEDLVEGMLTIQDWGFQPRFYALSQRVGVTQGRDLPLRFFLPECPFVSPGPKPLVVDPWEE